jgi:hypothetical protein
MSLSLLFWIIMLVWLVFGLWREYVPGQPYPFARGAGNLLVFVLLGLLGWQVFGPAIR